MGLVLLEFYPLAGYWTPDRSRFAVKAAEQMRNYLAAALHISDTPQLLDAYKRRTGEERVERTLELSGDVSETSCKPTVTVKNVSQ